MHHAILLLLLATLITACGQEPTMGARFREFGAAYCGRQVECEMIDRSDRATCIDEEVSSSCFEPRDCDSRDYYLDEGLWDDCLARVGTYECDSIAKGLAPADCINAWRPPGHRL